MPQLTWFLDGFRGAYTGADGRYREQVPLTAMLRAAITVGKDGPAALTASGRFSRYERRWRAAMVAANVDATPAGPWRKSPAYSRLDGSEKCAVSYFLGMTVTKLLCERMFGVSWLCHLSQFPHLNATTFRAGKSRPDFVGQDLSGRWIVAEAKGRSWGWDIKAEDDAKRQTRQLRQISGAWPALRVAVQSYFDGDELAVSLLDPIEYEQGAEDLPLDSDQLLHAYYGWILRLLSTGTTERIVEGVSMTMAPLQELGLEIGVPQVLLGPLREGRWGEVRERLIASNHQRAAVPLVEPPDDEVKAVAPGAPTRSPEVSSEIRPRMVSAWPPFSEPSHAVAGLDGIMVIQNSAS